MLKSTLCLAGGLYTGTISHFDFLKLTSIGNTWISLGTSKLLFRTFAGMSSLIYTSRPPLAPLTLGSSSRNGAEYPGIENWLVGYEESSFVSAMQRMSILFSVIPMSLSNLFVIVLIFKYEHVTLFGFLSFRSLITLCQLRFFCIYRYRTQSVSFIIDIKISNEINNVVRHYLFSTCIAV